MSDATCYKSNVQGSCLGDILVVDLVYADGVLDRRHIFLGGPWRRAREDRIAN